MSTGAYSRRAIYLLFFTFIMILASPIGQGREKTLGLEKIKSGMSGYGYTVFSGTKIEKFDVNVIALVNSDQEKENLILVKLSGKKLADCGGLAAGMSGSPVYINNKLIGAISYGFENADPFLALVTPIDSMVKLFPGEAATVNLKDFSLKPVSIVSPVMVSGMGKRGFDLVSHLLEPYGMRPVFVPELGRSSLEMGKGLVQPGSAIAVQMVAGDYQVSAIGTVTLIEGNSFLAFGHSYMNKGYVDYFTYQANILHTVKSPIMSFKVGSPLKLIGRITQDRQHGISGKLEETPEIIPVRVNVKDNDRNITKDSLFYVVAKEPVFADLMIAGITDVIDQTIDRVGPGTAKATVNIEINDRMSTISKENIFYGKDIAYSCLADLRNLLEILTENDFSNVMIKNVQVNLEITGKQASARIMKLVSETPQVKPGDTVKVNVRIHPYRGDNLNIPYEIKLPTNIKPGQLLLTVYGGSRESSTIEEDSKKEPVAIDYKNTESLNDLLADSLTTPKNYELVFEYNPDSDQKVNQATKSSAEMEKGALKPVQLKTNTPYYLQGEAQLTIEVESP